MNHQVKLKRNNRIAEYFVVISSPDILCPIDETDDESFRLTEANFMTARYEAAVVDRYPLVNRKDSKLPEGIEYFCLPNGLTLLTEINKPLFHSFVHTTDDGSRKLGCCLTIYERLSKSQQDSLFTLIATDEQLINYEEHKEEEAMASTSHNLTAINEVDIEEDLSDKMSRLENMSAKSYRDRDLRELLATLYLPKCLCLISSWPFVTSFKKFLVGIYNISRLRALGSEGGASTRFGVRASSTTSDPDTSSLAMSSPSPRSRSSTPELLSRDSSVRSYLNIGRSAKAEIPLERYICNFLDDVPAPPAGRVDIIYYLADQVLSFRCPAANEPNVWSGLPLFALFECLSPENVCHLFALVLTERQILFVSSQYSLLTACAEAITSLIYPLTWSHAYIPILPYQLLGVLGAPFPFILGLHSSTYENQRTCPISEETVRVLLDENRILFGSLGPAPALPERRHKKLLAHIKECAPVFENRASRWSAPKAPIVPPTQPPATPAIPPHSDKLNNTASTASATAFSSSTAFPLSPSRVNNFDHCTDDWHLTRLPYFDDAYSSVSEKETFLGHTGTTAFNEGLVREGFLKFFVAIMKNYKKHLIYGNSDNPDPIVKFRFQEFLSEQPVDWQPFIRDMIDTQAFSQFVDERVLLFKQDQDVLYFDESIDAKMNRYTFKFKNIDTPFLLDSTSKHIKTYVSPSPDTAGLLTLLATLQDQRRNSNVDEEDIDRFPKLNHMLYSKPRQIVVQFDGMMSAYAVFNQIRLKRKASYVPPPNNVIPPHASVYSCYLVIISQMIIMEMQKLAQTLAQTKAVAPSTQFIIEEFNHAKMEDSSHGGAVLGGGSRDRQDSHERQRLGSFSGHRDAALLSTPEKGGTTGIAVEGHSFRARSASIRNIIPTPSKIDAAKYQEDYQATAKACKLALRIAFEALNCLSRLDYAPGESVFRALADACGACGDSDAIIDLLVYMDDQGLLPDHQMLHAVVRALAANPSSAITSSDTPSTTSRLDVEKTPVAHQTSTTSRLYNIFRGGSAAGASTMTTANVSEASGATTTSREHDRSDSVSSATPGPRLRNKVISPVEVWTFTDWRSLQRGTSSLVPRKTPFVTTENTTNESKMTKMLFGPSLVSQDGSTAKLASSSGSTMSHASHTSHSTASAATTTAAAEGIEKPEKAERSSSSSILSSPGALIHSVVKAPVVAVHAVVTAPVVAVHAVASVLSPSAATTNHLVSNSTAAASPTSASSATGAINYSDLSFRWSSTVLTDGIVPKLQWSHLTSAQRHPIFFASKKLYRHMRICEKRLIENFPDLNIELESPFGTLCPNKKCPVRRPLTMGEIHQGWNHPEVAGDANKYTTKCIHCAQEFIPRIQITCKLPHLLSAGSKGAAAAVEVEEVVTPSFGPTSDSSSSAEGSNKDPDGYELWAELLNPWVLSKELLNILYQDGIESVLDCNFLKPGNSVSNQRMIVFWNLLIAFRLRGLPYTFLLSNDSIVTAFPLAPPPPSVSQAGTAAAAGPRGAPKTGTLSTLVEASGRRRPTASSFDGLLPGVDNNNLGESMDKEEMGGVAAFGGDAAVDRADSTDATGDTDSIVTKSESGDVAK